MLKILAAYYCLFFSFLSFFFSLKFMFAMVLFYSFIIQLSNPFGLLFRSLKVSKFLIFVVCFHVPNILSYNF